MATATAASAGAETRAADLTIWPPLRAAGRWGFRWSSSLFRFEIRLHCLIIANRQEAIPYEARSIGRGAGRHRDVCVVVDCPRCVAARENRNQGDSQRAVGAKWNAGAIGRKFWPLRVPGDGPGPEPHPAGRRRGYATVRAKAGGESLWDIDLSSSGSKGADARPTHNGIPHGTGRGLAVGVAAGTNQSGDIGVADGICDHGRAHGYNYNQHPLLELVRIPIQLHDGIHKH